MACSLRFPTDKLTFVKKGTADILAPSTATPLKIGDALVEIFGTGTPPVFCGLTVSEQLCFNIDPSPDSPKKTLEVTYSCSRTPKEKRTIEAAKGANLVLSCPQD